MSTLSEQPADDKHEAALTWPDMARLVQALARADEPLREASLPVRTRLDIGPRGTMILNQIATGRVRPSQIAAKLNVGRSLISADLARIEKLGLVDRKPGKDLRSAELSLTKLGLAIMFEVKANLEKLIQARIGHYTKAELDFCTKVLTELRAPAPTK